MILMLAPGPNMTFGSMPSGTVYTSDQNNVIKILNNSTADMAALQAASCAVLSPCGGWGNFGFTLLSDLYTADLVTGLVLPGVTGYPQHVVASVFADGANTGTWLKTGTGNGSGNWTQETSILTLPAVSAQVAANASAISTETTRAEGAESTQTASVAAVSAQVAANASAISTETGRAEAAESTLSTSVAGEIARAEGAETALTTSVVSSYSFATQPYVWADDPQFVGGSFDASGYPVLAIDAWGQPRGALADKFVGVTYLWADEAVFSALSAGQVATVDLAGNLVIPYGSVSGPAGLLDNYAGYVTPGGAVAMTDITANAAGLDISIASTRGTIRGYPTSKGSILNWMDDATASANAPPHERRWFDASGGSYLAGLGGIATLVSVVDMGHSLTVGAICNALLTTSPPLARAAMFNGGTKVTQPNPGWTSPPPICDDGRIQSFAPLVESELANGQGESHGGGVATWFARGSNLAGTEALHFSTVGAGGAAIANLAVGTTQFTNLIRVLERAAALAAFNSWAWEAHVSISIGENDYSGYQSDPTGFTAAMVALQSAVETAVKAIYTNNGWSAPAHIPLVMIQPSSWTSNNLNSGAGFSTMALAYAFPALVRSYANQFVLVGPGYYTANYYTAAPYPESIHKTALGYKLDGEYIGRTIQKLRASAAPPGLYVTGVSNSGATLTITTNATTNLATDTSVVPDPGQYGLDVYDVTASSSIALTGISVSGASVIATLASHTAGHTLRLGVGDVGTAGNAPGRTTGPRACIRDSSADVSSSDTSSTPMYNYLCHDQIIWTASA